MLRVNQLKHWAPSLLAERVADFVSDQSKKGLKVNPFPSQVAGDHFQSLEDDTVLFVEAKCAGSVEDVWHIALSSVVAVEVKHLEEVFTLVLGEDGVFGYNLSGKDSLVIFFGQLFPAVEHNELIIFELRLIRATDNLVN